LRVWATSANATSAPLPANQSANTPAIDPTRSPVLPDTTNVLTAGPLFTTEDARSGPCYSTTSALVPPNPNDDTPARRGRCTEGQPVSVAMKKFPLVAKWRSPLVAR